MPSAQIAVCTSWHYLVSSAVEDHPLQLVILCCQVRSAFEEFPYKRHCTDICYYNWLCYFAIKVTSSIWAITEIHEQFQAACVPLMQMYLLDFYSACLTTVGSTELISTLYLKVLVKVFIKFPTWKGGFNPHTASYGAQPFRYHVASVRSVENLICTVISAPETYHN